jgi:hypothetical protein
MAKLIYQHGGCWFCNQDDEYENLLFNIEYNTYVHDSCIRKALLRNSEEAKNMKCLLYDCGPEYEIRKIY